MLSSPIRFFVHRFREFSLKEFSEIRMIVSSRIFSICIEGRSTIALVPLADMLNHKHPKNVTWTYSDEKRGFIVRAVEDIKKGRQMYYSYGEKCNTRFFLNYGFLLKNNSANEVPVRLPYTSNDKQKKMKQEIISD